jgi:inosine-uridine nucleoside N-ribohydrolase
MNPIPILIDTDPGQDIDDVLALGFAALRPEFEIKAITTVTHGARRRAHLAKKLLETAGLGEVPVAAGMELPMRPVSDDELKQLTDDAYTLNHAQVEADGPIENDAVDLIIRTVEENAGELCLVTIAPLTNIACALRKAPHIAQKIRCISSMAAEVQIPHIEHNIAWDYNAASVVLAAKIPMFIGTWSVTRQFWLTPEDCETIRQNSSPLCQFMADCNDLWWPHKGGKPGPMMYDTSPFVWLMNPDFYTTEEMALQVETRGEFTQGMTLRRGNENKAQVTTAMDAEGVKQLYLDTVLGRA